MPDNQEEPEYVPDTKEMADLMAVFLGLAIDQLVKPGHIIIMDQKALVESCNRITRMRGYRDLATGEITYMLWREDNGIKRDVETMIKEVMKGD